MKSSAGLSAGLALVVLWSVSATAQDLTPRAYWPAPKGTRVAVVGYSYVSGDVLLDPTTPITGVDSEIHTGVLGYLPRTLLTRWLRSPAGQKELQRFQLDLTPILRALGDPKKMRVSLRLGFGRVALLVDLK